ncbi:MAG: GNAT family N-acetyltransferase [Bacteroidaceae bacterium]|nr:GNAT family N-acetyltransferase [Bacteroidaceae bacterium]
MTAFSEKDRRIERCRNLWSNIFGDSNEYITQFINTYYCDSNMLSIEDDDKLLSMLHIIHFKSNSFRIGYIFAVATHYEARCRGYASQLINDAIAIAKERGYDALALIPASKELYGYYTRFGFSGRYNVTFLLPDNFSFNSDNPQEDRVALLPLSERFTAPSDDSTIELVWED